MEASPRFVSNGRDRLRHLLHGQQIDAARSGLRSVVRFDFFTYPLVCSGPYGSLSVTRRPGRRFPVIPIFGRSLYSHGVHSFRFDVSLFTHASDA